MPAPSTEGTDFEVVIGVGHKGTTLARFTDEWVLQPMKAAQAAGQIGQFEYIQTHPDTQKRATQISDKLAEFTGKRVLVASFTGDGSAQEVLDIMIKDGVDWNTTTFAALRGGGSNNAAKSFGSPSIRQMRKGNLMQGLSSRERREFHPLSVMLEGEKEPWNVITYLGAGATANCADIVNVLHVEAKEKEREPKLKDDSTAVIKEALDSVTFEYSTPDERIHTARELLVMNIAHMARGLHFAVDPFSPEMSLYTLENLAKELASMAIRGFRPNPRQLWALRGEPVSEVRFGLKEPLLIQGGGETRKAKAGMVVVTHARPVQVLGPPVKSNRRVA